MFNTALSKTTHAAETLAASIIIQQLVEQVEISRTDGNLDVDALLEYSNLLDILATIVTSTFSPAEA